MLKKKVAIKKITPMCRHKHDAKHVLREMRLMRYLGGSDIENFLNVRRMIISLALSILGKHENIVTMEDLHIREAADELYIIMVMEID